MTCKGMNCTSTDGKNHSPECRAEYAATVAGGRFVKGGEQEADDDVEECREILTDLMRNIQQDGHYSIEATCTFIQSAINCLPVKDSK